MVCTFSNVSSTSIEVSEHIAPLRFHHKKLREESGGAGARRGGMGQDILIEVRSPTPIAVSFLAERTKMHHCIDIYAKTASRGQAQYYHVTAPRGKEYTVEQHAVSREKEVWLGQIKSHCNTDPTVEDRRFVRQLFTNGTQQTLQPGAQAAIPACHEVLDDDVVMF